MKAWIVYPIHDTWQALVFADTRSKARWMTARHYGCGNYDEAVCFRARRCQSMDGRSDTARVVEDDAMLIESGEFYTCDDCGRLLGDCGICEPCWQKYREDAR